MNLNSVLNQVRKYNEQGMSCSLSCLAVTHMSEKLVKREVGRYIEVLKRISQENLNSDVTVKMHQLGIYLEESIAYQAIEEIVMAAEVHHNFVWIDMYLPDTVDVTLKLFRQLRQKHQNVGVCLQAYLERTSEDLHELLKERFPVRLVKGFYREYDFDRWEDVTGHYESLLDYLLIHSDRPAIATHDRELIEKAKRVIQRNGATTAEFQFFKKVCDDLATELVQDGFNVRIYVPYGNVWTFLLKEVRTFDFWQNFKRLMNFLFSRVFKKKPPSR